MSLVAALATLMGTACVSVGPDFKPPAADSPPRWSDWHGGSETLSAPDSSTKTTAPPADPWSVFNDPDLTHMLVRCRGANQDIQIAILHVAQSRILESTVAAQRGVQVGAAADASRQRQSPFGSAARLVNGIPGINREQLLKFIGTPFTLYQAGFDASWELDLWGRVLRNEEAAQATTNEKRALLRQVQLSIDAELARAYFIVRSSQNQLLLAQSELAALTEEVELLKVQYEGGMIEEAAVIDQRVRLADLRALIQLLLNEGAKAMNQITLVCNAKPGELNAELSAPTTVRPDPILPDLTLGLPSELARHRPDVAAAEARLHVATANIGIAAADLYPRITLGASFGFETVADAKLTDWGGRQWSVGPSVSLPVFDHGRRQSTITLRKLEQQEAEIAYRQTLLKAFHEVDDALSKYTAETQRRAQLAEKAHERDEELMLAEVQYSKGMSTYQPELEARGALFAARRDLADGNARLSTALIALYKALGY